MPRVISRTQTKSDGDTCRTRETDSTVRKNYIQIDLSQPRTESAASSARGRILMFVLPAAGSECVPAGRVKVEPDCTLSQHPEVFVVGDLTLNTISTSSKSSIACSTSAF